MTNRMYFVVENVSDAHAASDQMLLAKVDSHQMHFIARPGIDLGDLPAASTAQRTDLMHGAQVGGVLGLFIGAAVGWYIYARMTPPAGKTFEAVVILVAALVGAGLGTWIASMIGASLPNSRHRRFETAIAAGRILMMIDAPLGRAVELRGLLLQRVPGTVDGGVEPAIPAFP
jgi:hypothetical protein